MKFKTYTTWLTTAVSLFALSPPASAMLDAWVKAQEAWLTQQRGQQPSFNDNPANASGSGSLRRPPSYVAVPTSGENYDCFFHALNMGLRSWGADSITRADAVGRLRAHVQDAAFRANMAQEIIEVALTSDYQIADDDVLRDPALGEFVQQIFEFQMDRISREAFLQAAATEAVVDDYIMNFIGAPHRSGQGFNPLPLSPRRLSSPGLDEAANEGLYGTIYQIVSDLDVRVMVYTNNMAPIFWYNSASPMRESGGRFINLMYQGGADIGHFVYLRPLDEPTPGAAPAAPPRQQDSDSPDKLQLKKLYFPDTAADTIAMLLDLFYAATHGPVGDLANQCISKWLKAAVPAKHKGETLQARFGRLVRGEGKVVDPELIDIRRHLGHDRWDRLTVDVKKKLPDLVSYIARFMQLFTKTGVLDSKERETSGLQDASTGQLFSELRGEGAQALRAAIQELLRHVRHELNRLLTETHKGFSLIGTLLWVSGEADIPQLIKGLHENLRHQYVTECFVRHRQSWCVRCITDLLQLQMAAENVARQGKGALQVLQDKLRKIKEIAEEIEEGQKVVLQSFGVDGSKVIQGEKQKGIFDNMVMPDEETCRRITYYTQAKLTRWYFLKKTNLGWRPVADQVLAEIEKWKAHDVLLRSPTISSVLTAPASPASPAPANDALQASSASPKLTRKQRHQPRGGQQKQMPQECLLAQAGEEASGETDMVLPACSKAVGTSLEGAPNVALDEAVESPVVTLEEAPSVALDEAAKFPVLAWKGRQVCMPTEQDFELNPANAILQQALYYAVLKEQQARQAHATERQQATGEMNQAAVATFQLNGHNLETLTALLTTSINALYHTHPDYGAVNRLFSMLGAEVIGNEGSRYQIRFNGQLIGGFEVGHEKAEVKGKVKALDGIYRALEKLLREKPEFRAWLKNNYPDLLEKVERHEGDRTS